MLHLLVLHCLLAVYHYQGLPNHASSAGLQGYDAAKNGVICANSVPECSRHHNEEVARVLQTPLFAERPTLHLVIGLLHSLYWKFVMIDHHKQFFGTTHRFAQEHRKGAPTNGEKGIGTTFADTFLYSLAHG